MILLEFSTVNYNSQISISHTLILYHEQTGGLIADEFKALWDTLPPPAHSSPSASFPSSLPHLLSPVGSQDSLLEITFRSTVPPVICDPTTPKPDVSALNLPTLGTIDGNSNVFSSSNGTLGSPLGRDQCLLKLECFRFLPGPPPPRLPSPPPLFKANRPEIKGQEVSEGTAQLLSRDVKSLGCLDFARFRESGIASEYESNTDDSDDNEDEGEDDEEGMEIFGWGTDEETLRLLNVLNRQGTPDCLGDEIAV